ncbi:hypothetical protein EW146_g3682 [Bondarzewia mesenterica]|uniref:Terpene synthase n=1 Tax=Bondarzewia mesenterica TaxID=1095465 RepID=A0A4S4LWV6_9AGAM|nr:hypothetical protein EW146_g3682 [Bondarzewia mesenterica]
MSCTNPDAIVLPDFISYCKYPLRISPYRHEVAAQSEAWLLASARLNAKKRRAFVDLKASDLASMCYPDADQHHLRVVADFINYLFKLDDWTDEFAAKDVGGMRDCVLGALRDPKGFQTDKGVGKLAKSFFGRFMEDGGPGCAQRFIDGMVLFFSAVTQEARDRSHHDIADLESYIALRRDTGGCKSCFALIEYAAGIDIPDSVMQHPSIGILEEATNDIVAWTNDIFSYDVEAARGDIHNIVIVVMNEQDISLQEAVDFVGDLCNHSIDTFEQVEKYVDGLQNWIIGSLHWSFETPRYFGNKGLEIKHNLIMKLSPKKIQN